MSEPMEPTPTTEEASALSGVTHDPLTADEIKAIRARVEAATPRPWGTTSRPTIIFTRKTIADVVHQYSNKETWANAEFIAHARTDIPRLLATLVLKSEALEKATTEIARVRAEEIAFRQELIEQNKREVEHWKTEREVVVAQIVDLAKADIARAESALATWTARVAELEAAQRESAAQYVKGWNDGEADAEVLRKRAEAVEKDLETRTRERDEFGQAKKQLNRRVAELEIQAHNRESALATRTARVAELEAVVHSFADGLDVLEKLNASDPEGVNLKVLRVLKQMRVETKRALAND